MPGVTELLATFDLDRMRMAVEPVSGFRMVLDGGHQPSDDPGPMQAVLAALAGCAAIDVATILRKKRQRPASYEIAVQAERAEAHPRVYTAITVEHRVRGGVSPEALRRSIELSATRYCPVSAMLSQVRVEHRYHLVDEDGAQHEALVAVTGPDGARVI